MTQLALDLHTVAAPTLSNFIVGANAECLTRLRAIAAGDRSQQLVYLWGLPGSGRSHLLRALAGSEGGIVAEHTAPAPESTPSLATRTTDPIAASLLGPATPIEAFAAWPGCPLYLVDEVQRMDDARQQALFHLINQVRGDPGAALIACGATPPLGLALRDDLRTRLGWGLVFELHLLSDDEKAAALHSVASDRGVRLAADVVPWLLTHRSRDIRVLIAVLDALDRHAFSRKRPITLPLLREWLRSDEGRRFRDDLPEQQD